jgi:hypothetical protein
MNGLFLLFLQKKPFPEGTARRKKRLFSFKTVATRAFFRVAIAGVAHVDTGKGAVVA